MGIKKETIQSYLSKSYLTHEEYKDLLDLKKFFNYQPERAWKNRVFRLALRMACDLAAAPTALDCLSVKEKFRNCYIRGSYAYITKRKND